MDRSVEEEKEVAIRIAVPADQVSKIEAFVASLASASQQPRARTKRRQKALSDTSTVERTLDSHTDSHADFESESDSDSRAGAASESESASDSGDESDYGRSERTRPRHRPSSEARWGSTLGGYSGAATEPLIEGSVEDESACDLLWTPFPVGGIATSINTASTGPLGKKGRGRGRGIARGTGRERGRGIGRGNREEGKRKGRRQRGGRDRSRDAGRSKEKVPRRRARADRYGTNKESEEENEVEESLMNEIVRGVKSIVTSRLQQSASNLCLPLPLFHSVSPSLFSNPNAYFRFLPILSALINLCSQLILTHPDTHTTSHIPPHTHTHIQTLVNRLLTILLSILILYLEDAPFLPARRNIRHFLRKNLDLIYKSSGRPPLFLFQATLNFLCALALAPIANAEAIDPQHKQLLPAFSFATDFRSAFYRSTQLAAGGLLILCILLRLATKVKKSGACLV